MKKLLLLTSCLLASTSAFAQVASPSPAYQECTALASSDPSAALAKADAWLKMDTSIAAQHCRAMALYGLRRFGEAGDALAAVRDGIGRDNPAMRSYMARQASQGYANANQADKAMAILSNELDELSNTRGDNVALAKMTSDLLLDRAKLSSSYGKLDEAAKDLDHAVSLTPLNDSVLAERANVFEKLGDKALARNDAEAALKLNANNSAAKDMLKRFGVIQPAPSNLVAPMSSNQAASIVPAAAADTADETAAPAPKPKKFYKKKAVAKKQPASTPASQAP